MRILVLQRPRANSMPRRDQRVDDRLVGVALLAVVVDDARRPALAVRAEARRVLGEKPASSTVKGMAVSMPRARSSLGAAHPGLEVLAAVAGRGVDEAGAGVVGDVVAGEHGDGEGVAAAEARRG
jgi:hypothetical protein